MEFFDTFPYTKLQGKNRALDWVMQKIASFQKEIDKIPDYIAEYHPDETEHAKSRDNPHKVTAEQVGARPDTWMPSASDVGAAPDGHGLGSAATPKNWDEIDSLITNGKYKIGSINQTINNIYVTSACVEVVYYGYNYGKQILHTVETASGLSESYNLERSRGYVGWGPWECRNPPMVPGVEYRATERHDGKPVYTMLFNFGIAPSATTKQVAHNIANVEKMLTVTGSNFFTSDGSNGATIPYDTVALGGGNSNCCGNNKNVAVFYSGDGSLRTVYLTLRYTKTTD